MAGGWFPNSFDTENVTLITPLLELLMKYNPLEWESRFTFGLNAAKDNGLYWKMLSNKNCSEFPTKNLLVAYLLSTAEVELRNSNDLPFLKYCNALEWESRFTLRLNAVKILIISNNATNKSCQNFLQKTHWMQYLHHLQKWSWVTPMICHFLNIIMYCNEKVGSLSRWTRQKILIISKNASDKNCPKLNLLTQISLPLEWS